MFIFELLDTQPQNGHIIDTQTHGHKIDTELDKNQCNSTRFKNFWHHTGCLKKTPLKEMCDFLTLKMLPLALALIKTKNRHLFDPLVKN